MRRIISLLGLMLIVLSGIAQENKDEIRTLFGKNRSNGGYGAFGYRVGLLGDRTLLSNGGQGGWVMNHTLVLGGGGYGFNTTRTRDANLGAASYQLQGGYGGMLLEPILLPKFPVHISLPILLGAGGIEYRRMQHDFYYTTIEDNSAFFIVEPGLEIELNLLKFMRIAIGAYYRHTVGIDLQYQNSELSGVNGTKILDSEDFNDFSYGVSFKFGKF